MSDKTTWIVIAVIVLVAFFFLRRKKVAVTNVLPTNKPSVSVAGTTVTGGLANSNVVQGVALGLAAAPAIGGLFSGLFGSSTPAVAGSAPAQYLEGSDSGYDDSIFGASTNESGMDLVG